MRLPLIASLFLAAALLAVPAVHAAAWDDYYVDNTWTGATLGTMAAPFTNIQAAIDLRQCYRMAPLAPTPFM